MKITREQMQNAVRQVNAHGGIKEASRKSGVAYTTLQRHYSRAVKQGLTGTEPVLDGFEISQTTASYDRHGNLVRESIQQKPEAGEVFEVPEGHRVKGVSAFLGPDGRKRGEWVKTDNRPSAEDDAKSVRNAFENFTPRAPLVLRPIANEDRLNTYIYCDWHLGGFAWGKETNAADWDLTIGQEVIENTIDESVRDAPAADSAVILMLGDLMHADNDKSQTPASGNPLDTDSRYAKVQEVATDTVLHGVERVRERHRNVKISVKRGNHDPNAMAALRLALGLYYRDADGITVDRSPSPFFAEQFGINMIFGAHGDGIKPEQIPLFMATGWPQIWAATKTRHGHTGHRHHKEIRMKEYGGVPVYSHAAPVPVDAWHAWKGFGAGRSMPGFSYDRHRGYRGDFNAEIFADG